MPVNAKNHFTSEAIQLSSRAEKEKLQKEKACQAPTDKGFLDKVGEYGYTFFR